MIEPDHLKAFFPPSVSGKVIFKKYMLKEYLQVLLLEYLSSTPYIRGLSLIGGTNLRLSKGIDRFSEDIDFDCKSFSEKEFMHMTDKMITFLEGNGYLVETREKKSKNRTAYLRNLFFPGLLFDLGLSAHRNERFLIKIEAEDQGFSYKPVMTKLKSCGVFLAIPAPPDEVLCAMKISALLSRQKGRDFYDAMFLLGQTEPDFGFLAQRHGIHNKNDLQNALLEVCMKVNLQHKAKDFEHLCFDPANSKRILHFENFVRAF